MNYNDDDDDDGFNKDDNETISYKHIICITGMF